MTDRPQRRFMPHGTLRIRRGLHRPGSQRQVRARLYYENEPDRAANLLTRDEARRIAIKMAKLPELLRRPRY